MKRLFLVLLSALPAVAGEDPVAADPVRNRLLLENPQVRVFETRLGPGEVSPSHSHPDFVAYTLTDARLKITLADGKTREIDLPSGVAAWNPAQTHTIQNGGSNEARILHVELNPPRSAERPVIINPPDLVWKPASPPLPRGAEIAILEGDPAQPGPFTLRIKFPAGTKIPPHWHPADEHATVVSGKLHIGVGDTFDAEKTKAVDVCGFSVMPAGMHHFGWFPQETVLQLHGNGPWKVVYLEKP